VCKYAIEAATHSFASGKFPDLAEIIRGCAYTLSQLAKSRAPEKSARELARLAEEWFATTLVLVIIQPLPSGSSKITTISAGDSAVWILEDGHFRILSGGKVLSDDGPASSSVVALPRIWPMPTSHSFVISDAGILLVMSDGIGDALGDGTGVLGDLLKRQLPAVPSIYQFGRLADFSREVFDDDRTLVAVWPVSDV
jgi:hypothetical protein